MYVILLSSSAFRFFSFLSALVIFSILALVKVASLSRCFFLPMCIGKMSYVGRPNEKHQNAFQITGKYGLFSQKHVISWFENLISNLANKKLKDLERLNFLGNRTY